MDEYRRLNFNKLNFASSTITYEEALKNVTPLELPESIVSGNKKISITKAEKDYKNKCVKCIVTFA